MILKNNKIFESISSELALFLVNKTRYKIYYVFHLNDNQPMILLTKENIDKYTELHDDAINRRVADNGIFQCLGELPTLVIKTFSNNKYPMQIESFYDDYQWLNWSE